MPVVSLRCRLVLNIATLRAGIQACQVTGLSNIDWRACYQAEFACPCEMPASTVWIKCCVDVGLRGLTV